MFIFLALALLKRYSELAVIFDRNLPSPADRNYIFNDLSAILALAAAAGYLDAIELDFGDEVDAGVFEKVYDDKKRYIGSKRKTLRGALRHEDINTWRIERENGFLRQANRRLTRKTNVFSKRMAYHERQIAIGNIAFQRLTSCSAFQRRFRDMAAGYATSLLGHQRAPTRWLAHLRCAAIWQFSRYGAFLA